ncbi:MAG: hypothetical protein ACK5MK_10625 [Dysgonomonas sp.]
MKKNYFLFSSLMFASFLNVANISAQSNGDIIFSENFSAEYTEEGAYHDGTSITPASSSYANMEKTLRNVIFNSGSAGQRINHNINQAVNATGTYAPATTADEGATIGAISFLKTGDNSTNKGAYLVLPELTQPFDLALWLADGTGNYDQYLDVYTKSGAEDFALKESTTTAKGKLIYKKTIHFTGSGPIKVKLLSNGSNGTGSSSTNLYVYDIVATYTGQGSGIDQNEASQKTVVSKIYFDLTGKQILSTQDTSAKPEYKGVVIEKTVYDDSSSSIKKTILK